MYTIETLEPRTLLAFGEIDPAWGEAGRFTLDVNGSSEVIQDLVVGGQRIYGATGGNIDGGILFALTLAGALDSTFAGDGTMPLPAGLVADQAVDGDGNLYVLINTQDYDGPGAEVLKFSGSGQPVAGFGTAGVLLAAGGADFTGEALAVQPDGKLLVAGELKPHDARGAKSRILRLASTGTPDSTFGQNGIADFQVAQGDGTHPAEYDRVLALRLLGGGTIALAEFNLAFKPDAIDANFHLIPGAWGPGLVSSVRLTASGQFDSSFGTSGVARSSLISAARMKKFAESGHATRAETEYPFVATLRPDGASAFFSTTDRVLGRELASDGAIRWTSVVDEGSPLAPPMKSVLLADGRIVLAGNRATVESAPASGPTLVAVSTSGTFANFVFGDDLRQDLSQISGSEFAAALASDGKILVSGRAGSTSRIQINKFEVGQASDPRPDDFAGAQNNSLALGRKLDLHLAFYHAPTKTFRYAHRAVNGQWEPTRVIDATPLCGLFSSIQVNRDNQPMIAYYDRAHGDLKFAETTNFGQTWTIRTLDRTGVTGLYPSLQVDMSGRPLIAYYRQSSGDLVFAARNSTGRWGLQVVDSQGDVGRGARLVTQDFIYPVIGYVDDTNRAVKVAFRRPGGAWDIERAAKSIGRAYDLSLSAQPWTLVSFYDSGPKDLRVAFRIGTWSTRTVASNGNVGLFGSVAYGSDSGAPWEYAYDRTGDRVVLFPRIISTGDDEFELIRGGGRFLSTVTSVGGQPTTWIAYYDTLFRGLRVRTTQAPPSIGVPQA
jgi:uncharacterized delta-60 repeat protein